MRYLMILEVSQKQAYIFSSNKLKENIENSEAICRVTDPEYFEAVTKKNNMPFEKETQLVYSGGGHTVLEFADEQDARDFAFLISRTVRRDYPYIELFIKTMQYDEQRSASENLEKLTQELEKKKSVRAASFRQGSFGVEKIDTDKRKPRMIQRESQDSWETQDDYVPAGYKLTKQIEQIGGEKNSGFIAIIHIDGNAMGKRIRRLEEENKSKPWEEFKKSLRMFSQSIDNDYKEAFREMMDRIAQNIQEENPYFPVRKIILAGDDVCFLTEGSIGLEAARIFIENLGRKVNAQDHQKYHACAGVALVHRKYPFYKAYELSEMLCSNAKKYLASAGPDGEDAGEMADAIDWHIEFGELEDSLAEVRKGYITVDGNHLEMRPYLISAEETIWKCERVRRYENVRTLIRKMQGKDMLYARGKIKEFREALKEGEEAADYYVKSQLMEDYSVAGYSGIFIDMDYDRLLSGKGQESGIFIKTKDGVKRSLYFDAIELLDTFTALE